MRLVYLEEARTELLLAVAWYEECQEGLGSRFYHEIEAAEDGVLQHPEHFPYGLI